MEAFVQASSGASNVKYVLTFWYGTFIITEGGSGNMALVKGCCRELLFSLLLKELNYHVTG